MPDIRVFPDIRPNIEQRFNIRLKEATRKTSGQATKRGRGEGITFLKGRSIHIPSIGDFLMLDSNFAEKDAFLPESVSSAAGTSAADLYAGVYILRGDHGNYIGW